MRIRLGRIFGMVCLATLMAFPPAGRLTAGQVHGTVNDREGKPAAGAEVWAAKLGFIEAREVHQTTADASGGFAIEAGSGDWAVFALRGDEGGRGGWGS